MRRLFLLQACLIAAVFLRVVPPLLPDVDPLPEPCCKQQQRLAPRLL